MMHGCMAKAERRKTLKILRPLRTLINGKWELNERKKIYQAY